MLLTIDSSEPLAKVAAVVGALYGVELVVAEGSAPAASSSSRRRGSRSSGTTAAKRSSSRRSRGGTPSVDARTVRQWAVERGLTVSSRGQLSKAVLDAYAADNA